MSRTTLIIATALIACAGRPQAASAQDAPPVPEAQQVRQLPRQKLAGPRFGFTAFTGEVADMRNRADLEAIMTQFGWQWETQILSLTGGSQALMEWVLLLGGVEQDEFNLSLGWLTGYRLAKKLFYSHGIDLELYSENVVVGIFGMGEPAETGERLVAALRASVGELEAEPGPAQSVASTPTPVDLHLLGTSPCIGFGFEPEVVSFMTTILSATVPGFPVPSLVRRDIAYDIDFEGRIEGAARMLQAVDLGADEFTGIDPVVVPSPTRGAVLQRTMGSTIGTDMDIFGNLGPDANGLWNSQVEVVGTPGDFVIFMAGFGFLDRVLRDAVCRREGTHMDGT